MSIRGQLGKSQAGSRYLTKTSLTTVMLVLCIYQCITPPFSAVPELVAVSLSAQSSPIAAIDRDLITHTVYEEEGKGRGKGGRKEKGNRKRKTSKNPSTQSQPSRGPQEPSPSQSKRGKEGGSSKPKRKLSTRGSKGKEERFRVVEYRFGACQGASPFDFQNFEGSILSCDSIGPLLR